MIIRKVLPEERKAYDGLVNHPMQSWGWGEFKKGFGARVERVAEFENGEMKKAWQVFFHRLPGLDYTVGYFPKGPRMNKKMVAAVADLARENKAIFVKFEPDQPALEWNNKKGSIGSRLTVGKTARPERLGLRLAKRPLFTPYSFVMDLTKTEEQLLENMHPKTRYNIRLAEKKGVIVEEANSKEALNVFLKLLFSDTIRRQGFYMHNPDYFRKMWQQLESSGMARIFLARYQEKILSIWMIFVFQGKIYYPYGASSSKMRNLMASNLLCWRVIQFGKKVGAGSFDMWGSLGPKADPTHPWYGFHRFKLGYGGRLVKSVGSWDLVINEPLYVLYGFVDQARWKFLRLKSRLSI